MTSAPRPSMLALEVVGLRAALARIRRYATMALLDSDRVERHAMAEDILALIDEGGDQ